MTPEFDSWAFGLVKRLFSLNMQKVKRGKKKGKCRKA
jgi:hypothetical protein